MDTQVPVKPLGGKAYGSIPHLPGSRRGPADKGLSEKQARILTEKSRDYHDIITVQEKLDGSCVAVAKKDGVIIPLIRAGYLAESSPYEMHSHFAFWVYSEQNRFNELLREGERICGEWLMEAHGTRYQLIHEPFVAFDIFAGNTRLLAADVAARCFLLGFITPRVIHIGGPMSIEEMLSVLEPSGHGAIDPVEGAVWRVERNGVVDFLGKYVRPDKVDGKYLNGVGGATREPIYNWHPSPDKIFHNLQ